MRKIINLEKFMEDGAKVLSGRDTGILARMSEELEEFDKEKDSICKVVIPKQIWSLNSSFFLGLFGPSIRSLGEAGFRNKYEFDYNGNNEIKNDVEQGIEDAKSKD